VVSRLASALQPSASLSAAEQFEDILCNLGNVRLSLNDMEGFAAEAENLKKACAQLARLTLAFGVADADGNNWILKTPSFLAAWGEETTVPSAWRTMRLSAESPPAPYVVCTAILSQPLGSEAMARVYRVLPDTQTRIAPGSPALSEEKLNDLQRHTTAVSNDVDVLKAMASSKNTPDFSSYSDSIRADLRQAVASICEIAS